MTANAFGADRDACLAAGMNDHIGKPVNPATLYEKLLRWLDESRKPPRPRAGRSARAGRRALAPSRWPPACSTTSRRWTPCAA